jgi:hypothetical protein
MLDTGCWMLDAGCWIRDVNEVQGGFVLMDEVLRKCRISLNPERQGEQRYENNKETRHGMYRACSHFVHYDGERRGKAFSSPLSPGMASLCSGWGCSRDGGRNNARCAWAGVSSSEVLRSGSVRPSAPLCGPGSVSVQACRATWSLLARQAGARTFV